MTTNQLADTSDASPQSPRAISASDQRTLQSAFRHPVAHNLEWTSVVSLMKAIGEVNHRHNDEFEFKVLGKVYLTHKPHTKDLTSTEVTKLRKFLTDTGYSADSEPIASTTVADTSLNLLVTIDHHDARIYNLAGEGDGVPTDIKPYDPHHFRHHLAHKDQSNERGQRASEGPGFFKDIAESLKDATTIVLVGHGTGKSNEAAQLSDYLSQHYPMTFKHVVRQLTADLSAVTAPQLLELARSNQQNAQ
jgi:hypothetical protein